MDKQREEFEKFYIGSIGEIPSCIAFSKEKGEYFLQDSMQKNSEARFLWSALNFAYASWQ